MNDSLHVVCAHCGTTNRVPRERLDAQPICGQCQQTLFDGHPIELNAANFDRHVASNDLPLVVDFWAPWCGPCRAMAPAFEQAAARLEPNARLGKLNSDEAQDIATRFGIRGIPTLIAFKGGKEIARTSGAMQLPALLSWISAHAVA
jgi:thioredoxin 2